MNCTKCWSEVPPAATYCPVCGARRTEIDRLTSRAQAAAEKAVGVGVAALDRVSKEMQPAVGRIASALQPAADGIGRALQPIVESTARAVNDIADSVQPMAQETAEAARALTKRTMAVVRPAVAKAAERTGLAFQRIRERVRRP